MVETLALLPGGFLRDQVLSERLPREKGMRTNAKLPKVGLEGFAAPDKLTDWKTLSPEGGSPVASPAGEMNPMSPVEYRGHPPPSAGSYASR